jgi:hypothetical protein
MKTHNSGNTIFSLVKRGLLLGMTLAILLYSTKAQCTQWNVSGKWSIQQEKTVVNFQLDQKGSVVAGKADYTVPGKVTKVLGVTVSGEDQTVHHGDVDGTVRGDSYEVHVYWDNRSVGVYTGKISPGGRIEGEVYGKENPSVKVSWYSKINMNCPAALAGPPLRRLPRRSNPRDVRRFLAEQVTERQAPRKYRPRLTM